MVTPTTNTLVQGLSNLFGLMPQEQGQTAVTEVTWYEKVVSDFGKFLSSGVQFSGLFASNSVSSANDATTKDVSWDTDQTYPASGVKMLKVAHDEGSVKIEYAKTNTIQVKTRALKEGGSCKTDIKRNGSDFVVNTDKTAWRDCVREVLMIVPEGLQTKVDAGAVDVQLAGVGGDLELNLGTGTVNGTTSSKNSRIKLGAGTFNLSWEKQMSEGLIDIQVGTGQANLRFQRGTVADVDIGSGIGSVRNDLGTSSSSSFKIHGSLGVGSITLGYK